MDQILKVHEDMIDKHEYKLEDIQQDLIDVKVRLGIKDKTNGQVVEYQKALVDAQEQERDERKEQDKVLLARIDKLDEKIWYLVVSVGVMVLIEILMFIIQSHL